MASLAQTKKCSINVCFVCLLTFCVLIFSSSYMLWAFNDTLGLLWCTFLIYNYFSEAEDGSWDEFYYQLCLKIILGCEGQEFVAMQLLRRRAVKQHREEILKIFTTGYNSHFQNLNFQAARDALTWVSKEKSCQTNTELCGVAARQGDYSWTFTLNERTLNAALVAIGHRELHGGLSSSAYDASRHPVSEKRVTASHHVVKVRSCRGGISPLAFALTSAVGLSLFYSFE